ncbi:MAG TPA: carbohydrate kinase [Candidatus Dormibacteraeota bacterium]|jgi:fructokinase
MVVVCGEALVDLTPAICDGEPAFVARPGGSPCNVAVTLGRLEVPVAYMGRLSSDGFGRMLRDHLTGSGVDGRFLREGPEPSTLALVEVGPGGEPDFRFYGDRTADRMLRRRDLPSVLPAEVRALHFGSIALVREPGATTLERCMRRERPGRLITLDPNVRPGVMGDRSRYLRRLDGWLALADVVKVSRTDLAWLHPGEAPAQVAERWLARGPNLVVVTLAAGGSAAYTASEVVERPAPAVEVVDTVGAGDAFMGGLLAALHRRSLLDRDRLGRLTHQEVADCLGYAGRTAALTCARPGAQPPSRAEVEIGHIMDG